jgi:zinc transporter 1
MLQTLAAFFNSVFLLALGLGIFLQGIERLVHVQREFATSDGCT